jgi:multimeric flavodoxin WrbA
MTPDEDEKEAPLVLGLVGSPRKGGNTDLLVQEVLRGARESGAGTEIVYLGDLNLHPCRACGACKDTGTCVLEDDFHDVLKKIRSADGLVVGSPIYGSTVTAQTKILIDRVSSSQELIVERDGRVVFESRHPGTGTGIVVVVGDRSPEKDFRHTAWVLKLLLKDLGIEVFDTLLASKLNDPGDVLKRPELIGEAFKAGRNLLLL